MDELQPYIDDALDLIEFANGDITTEWGKLRNQMGHPQPFNLKYIGVGNEQWESQYIERYKVFEKTILAKYPSVKIVAGSGPSAEGDYFNYAWKEFKQLKPALIDEHYYKPPEWFFKNANRYDNYDRSGPKIFAGEYAAHSKDTIVSEGRNNWESALAEASFMTGLERNADIVQMASYAPLLAHVDAWQWRPDLIWFDNLQAFATPNYYVQKMFSNSKGTQVIPALKDGLALTGKDNLYTSAVIDKQANEIIIKITNISTALSPVEFTIEGIKTIKKEITVQELFAADLFSFNSVNQQQKVYPVERNIIAKGKKILIDIKPKSFSIIKIKL
jgi:alpha-N-arabinofuranosidase